MSACAATAFDEPGPVVVAPLEMGDALGEFGMTRDELEVQLRRFADRYMTRIAVVTSETDKQPMTTAEKKLMEGWNTSDGHRYVVCRFYNDGELESARLIDGHGPQYDKKIRDRIIGQPLSELEPKTVRASFESEDQ